MQNKITPKIQIEQRLSKTYERRFWKRVIRTNSCWIWIGGKARGQGYMHRGSADSGNIYASRLSWMMHRGPIPDGMEVCHNCPGGDNPACVNPDHLWLGTHRDNMLDMVAKGRNVVPKLRGDSHPGSRLTTHSVLEIRQRYETGEKNQYQLADIYGMAQPTISAIIRRRLWSHI